jgi:hypothetical protein
MPVVDDALLDDHDPLSDAVVSSESLANLSVPIAATPMEFLIPDERVMGFCPPLS